MFSKTTVATTIKENNKKKRRPEEKRIKDALILFISEKESCEQSEIDLMFNRNSITNEFN